MANKITYDELDKVTGGVFKEIKKNTCEKCGSDNMEKITKTDGCGKEYTRMRCKDCNHEQPSSK